MSGPLNLSSAAVDAALAAARRYAPECEEIRNGNWLEFDANGKTSGHQSGPCHGSVRGVGKELIVTLSPWLRVRYTPYLSYSTEAYKGLINEALATRFYDWFVNRSWAAPYVYAPDVAFARDYGLIVTTEAPANYVLAILTMSRHPGEQAHNVARMYDYVDGFGVSEDFAFFLAFGVNTSPNRYGSIIAGHNLFAPTAGVEALRRWMTRDFAFQRDSMRSGDGKTGVFRMFGDVPKVSQADAFKPYEAAVEARKVVIPNPFAPVVKSSAAMTEDYLRSIIPNLAKEFDTHDETMRRAA